MWIASKYGFFSIVQKGGPGQWMVRARVKNDLNILADRMHLPHDRVLTTSGTDYAYRMILTEEEKNLVFIILSDSVDYDNFKDAVKHTPNQKNKVGAYMQIWSIMARMQATQPYANHAHQTPKGSREPRWGLYGSREWWQDHLKD